MRFFTAKTYSPAYAFLLLFFVTLSACTQKAYGAYCSATVKTNCTPGGMVSDAWSFEGVPEAGLTSITFPFVVNAAPDAPGYYFAQQYKFLSGFVAYLGIRPRPHGAELAAFSVFGKGPTTVNTMNCSPGADDGPGVSCSLPTSFVHGHRYEFTVYRDAKKPTIWRGEIVDKTACDAAGSKGNVCEAKEIGAWDLGVTTGIANKQVGFVEYYDALPAGCGGVPKASVTFYAPSTPAGLASTVAGPKPYGGCLHFDHYFGSAAPDQSSVTADTGW